MALFTTGLEGYSEGRDVGMRTVDFIYSHPGFSPYIKFCLWYKLICKTAFSQLFWLNFKALSNCYHSLLDLECSVVNN